jgi:hypothetical protein
MSPHLIEGVRRTLGDLRDNSIIRISSLIREILVLGVSGFVLRAWLPQLLPGLSSMWIIGTVGLVAWRSLVLYEEHICDSLSDPTRLRNFVEQHLFSPHWWMQWYAVQRLSVIAGRRFGRLSPLPARFRHTVACWREWWTRERDRLTWDSLICRYIEKVA